MEKKVVIIGLDGVPYSLLNRFAEQGIMPRFRELMSEGSFQKIHTSLPEVSSVAWASFMTGKNPGEHGIFGFLEIKEASYEMYFPNYAHLMCPTFWESAGVPSVILNIPQTYPARPLNGVMTSGFVALDLQKATYPDRAYRYLNDIGYKIDVNASLARKDIPAFFLELADTFEKRRQAIQYFFDAEKWQIFVGTITETDRLHHFFYDSARETGKYYGDFVLFYKRLDEFLWEMYQKARKEKALFVTCSDHGFTEIRTEVYLNRWLIQEGFLEIEDREKGIQTITDESTAFCLDPSRIYLHRAGRYPRGRVNGMYDDIRRELKHKLGGLTFDGEPVVQHVYLREEIFNGPHSDRGPDLYVLPRYGFDFKGAFNKNAVFGTSHFRGMHTYDDAHLFMTKNSGFDASSIESIAPLVCRHLNGE